MHHHITTPDFVHLWVHSYYSFFDSTMSPEEIAAHAAEAGMGAVAMTDTNALTGAVDFVNAARAKGVRPILGAEIREPFPADRDVIRLRVPRRATAGFAWADDAAPEETGAGRAVSSSEGGSHSPQLMPGDSQRRVIALARNFSGYSQISQVVTRRMLSADFSLRDECLNLGDDVVLLSDCPGVLMELATGHAAHERSDGGCARLYAVLQASPRARRRNRAVYECALGLGVPLVVACNARLASPADAPLHDVLQAMRRLTTIHHLSDDERCDPYQHLASPAFVRQFFCRDSPQADTELTHDIAEAIANTVRIADACHCELPLGEWKFPTFTGLSGNPSLMLRELVERGIRRRYGTPPAPEALRRMDYELSVIERLQFTHYFLLVNRIVEEAHARGFLTIGRGSAANSIISYALGITNVCPIRYNLYFERFLNPERTAPPDIDIDFSWKERDEIIQWCFEFFGPERVALISTLQTLQARQAVREVAKAHGLSEREANARTQMSESGYPAVAAKAMALLDHLHGMRGKPDEEDLWALIHAQAQRLTDFPRHFSIHCGGIIIAPDAVTRYVPLTCSAKGFVITQMDMYSVEALGLIKIDLLGNRSIAVLKDALLLAERTVRTLEISGDARAAEAQLLQAESDPNTTPEDAPQLAMHSNTAVFQREAQRIKAVGTRRGTSVALAGVIGMFARHGEHAPDHALTTDETTPPPPNASPATLTRFVSRSLLRQRVFDFEFVTGDAATRQLIDAGRTMGCFYIESPGMRALLERLRCKNFEEVVAASSIIRPGVAESGMMQEYIVRHTSQRAAEAPTHAELAHFASAEDTPCVAPASQRLATGLMPVNAHSKPQQFRLRTIAAREASQHADETLPPAQVVNVPAPARPRHAKARVSPPPHPRLLEVLPETYGVMVYQEDVLRVAHEVAGMTFGEADLLRRAMSGKMRSRDAMSQIRERFWSGAAERGLSQGDVEEIWRQISSFAGYSFCKGHSAAFAVLSYQVAYLKAHFPAEFFAAVLSNEGGFYGAGAYLQEARRCGLQVLGPCVNASDVEFTGRTWLTARRRAQGLPFAPGDVRVGLMAVMSLRRDTQIRIVAQRRKHGPYTSLTDFVQRTEATHAECRMLVAAGALDAVLHLAAEHRRTGSAGEAATSPPNHTTVDDSWSTLPGRGRRARSLSRRTRRFADSWSDLPAAPTVPATTSVVTPPAECTGALRARAMLELEMIFSRHEAMPAGDLLAGVVECTIPERLASMPGGMAWSHAELCRHEAEALGYMLAAHPLDFCTCPPDVIPASAMRDHAHRRVRMAGWMIAAKVICTKTDQRPMKMLTLEDRTDTFEATLFPRVYERFGPVTLTCGPFLVEGVVDVSLGSATLNVSRIVQLGAGPASP